ncbi:unnamed protein product [Pleuronectes platessa]|uniref:Uncharacterized protein n=1 Tax=Pleuronectes platessa TaxID=8262 RepID=A0A9N7YJU7_PLEPL|nr:unnamed protein product [Pleuronectes platessa]
MSPTEENTISLGTEEEGLLGNAVGDNREFSTSITCSSTLLSLLDLGPCRTIWSSTFVKPLLVLSRVGPGDIGWQDNHDRTCQLHNYHTLSTYSILDGKYCIAAVDPHQQAIGCHKMNAKIKIRKRRGEERRGEESQYSDVSFLTALVSNLASLLLVAPGRDSLKEIIRE